MRSQHLGHLGDGGEWGYCCSLREASGCACAKGVVMDSSREAAHSPGSLHLCQMSLAAGVLRVQGVSARATLCPDLWRHLHFRECKTRMIYVFSDPLQFLLALEQRSGPPG